MGNRFTIITDNKALTFLHKCNLSNARMGRWNIDVDVYMCKCYNMYVDGEMKRTIQIFKESFTTDHLTRTVRYIITRCDTCQRCKDNTRRYREKRLPLYQRVKGNY